MKFNPLEWSPVNGISFKVPSGLLQLRSSVPFGVTVEVQGCEAAYGYAASHQIRLAEAATVSLKLDPMGDGEPVFRKDRPSRVYKEQGEVWTNIDRMPTESEHIAEVTRAVRMLKLEKRAMLREIREERDRLDQVIEASKPKADPETKPKSDPESKPKADPETKPKADPEPPK